MSDKLLNDSDRIAILEEKVRELELINDARSEVISDLDERITDLELNPGDGFSIEEY